MKWLANKNIQSYLAFGVIALFVLFTYFYGIFHFKYGVPPGDDCIRHMTEALHITQTGQVSTTIEAFDPPMFHILLSSLSQITGADIVSTTKFFAPGLAALSILSLYFLVKRLFGRIDLAILTVAIYALFSPQPEQIYGDGTYLNLFAAGYLLPVALAVIAQLLPRSAMIRWRMVILAVLLSAGLLLSHSLSSIYFLLIIAGIGLVLLIRDGRGWFKNRSYWVLIGGIIITLPLVWKFYLGGTIEKVLSVLGLVHISTSNILNADFSASIAPIPVLGDYYWYLNRLLILLGIVGLVLLPLLARKLKVSIWIWYVWVAVLLIGSRYSFFALPTRFARDLAIPICVLAAVGLYLAATLAWPRLKLIVIVGVLLLLPWAAADKVAQASQYNSLIRVQSADVRAFDWIKAHTNPNDVILGMPRTIVAGDWGSFINLFTNRPTLDGSLCPPGDDNVCDPIYQPATALAMKYYINQSIDYVYAGKMILGSFGSKNRIDWTYTEHLAEAPYLEQVAEFPENPSLGGVTIFKVNQDRLRQLYSQVTQ